MENSRKCRETQLDRRQGSLEWVRGEQSPGLGDSEEKPSGIGTEERLDCCGWRHSGAQRHSSKVEGLPECFWPNSLLVPDAVLSHRVLDYYLEVEMVREAPWRGWVGELHSSEKGGEVAKREWWRALALSRNIWRNAHMEGGGWGRGRKSHDKDLTQCWYVSSGIPLAVWVWNQTAWVWNLALPFLSCLTLGKLPYLSEPQFSHL